MKNDNDKKEQVKENADILHTGRLGVFSADVAKYTSSIDIDRRLIKAVLDINKAHVLMLSKQEILDSKTAFELLKVLSKVPENLKLKDVLEDVHMNIEDYVISEVGKQLGGMLNLAKSRNDQVSTALRIALRARLLVLGHSLLRLQIVLQKLATYHASTIMPGYTHLQRAQPVTLGHHLLAHFEAFDRDFSRLVDCYLRVNNCPMGSGAIAGSSYLLDRKYVAQLLGFDSIVENSVDAVSSRDFATESIYLCAQIITDLSRISEETILWTTREFSFAEISDRFSSTSSMMPQKKNAIVPEIGRAKAAQVLGDLVGSLGIMRSLPLSYNLDLQELTRNLWSALDNTISSLILHAEMMDEMKFEKENMKEATKFDDFLFATELADHLVNKYSLPFREAHGRVAALVKYCSELGFTKNQFSKVDENKLEEILGVGITKREICELTSPEKILNKRKTTGFPNPKLVRKSSQEKIARLKRHGETLEAFEDKIARSSELMNHEANALKKEFSLGDRKGIVKMKEATLRREDAAEVKQ